MYKTELIFKQYKNKENLNGINAYEAWHLYYYANIVKKYSNLNNLKDTIYKQRSNLGGGDKKKYFLILLLTKILAKKKIVITELGSSLLEIINGCNYFNKFFSFKINLNKILFVGIENSKLFNFLAEKLNYNKNKKIYSSYKDIKKTDIIYDRAVSSYCFKTETELIKFYNKSEIVYSNLSLFKKINYGLNKNFEFKSFNQYGYYKIFDIDKLRLLYKYHIYHIYGKKKPDYKEIIYKKKNKIYRIDGFFIFSKKLIHIKNLKNILSKLRYKNYKINFKFTKIENLNKNNFYLI